MSNLDEAVHRILILSSFAISVESMPDILLEFSYDFASRSVIVHHDGFGKRECLQFGIPFKITPQTKFFHNEFSATAKIEKLEEKEVDIIQLKASIMRTIESIKDRQFERK